MVHCRVQKALRILQSNINLIIGLHSCLFRGLSYARGHRIIRVPRQVMIKRSSWFMHKPFGCMLFSPSNTTMDIQEAFYPDAHAYTFKHTSVVSLASNSLCWSMQTILFRVCLNSFQNNSMQEWRAEWQGGDSCTERQLPFTAREMRFKQPSFLSLLSWAPCCGEWHLHQAWAWLAVSIACNGLWPSSKDEAETSVPYPAAPSKKYHFRKTALPLLSHSIFY